MNNLLSLLQLSDPALPIGGFSHSAGLETYVQYGLVNDRNTANEFIKAQLSQNIFYTDAALVSLAFDAAAVSDYDGLIKLDELCTAVKLPKEMRQASEKLGIRLLKLFSNIHSLPVVNAFRKNVEKKKAQGHYPVVFGLYSFVLGIEKKDALRGFLYNAAAGMVTNSVKLIPLGQATGQELLFSQHSLIDELAEKLLVPDEDLIGLCCTGFDIRCMQHEQLYSRLYMS